MAKRILGSNGISRLTWPLIVSTFTLLFYANIGAGAEPNADLVRAVQSRDFAGMRAALARKADPNVMIRGYRSFTSNGNKVEISGPPIFAVLNWSPAGNFQIDALELLKASGADFRARSSEDETIIVESFATAYSRSQRDELDILKALLKLGADPSQPSDLSYTWNEKPTKAGISALLEISQYGYGREKEFAAYVPILIAAGADPRSRWPWGDSALSDLLNDYEPRKKPILAAYLDAGVDPRPEDYEKLVTAIEKRKFGEDYALLDRVLAAVKDINAPNDYGDPLLYLVVLRYGMDSTLPGDYEKVLDLFKTRGADFNRSSESGEVSLGSALGPGRTELFDALVARGADPKAKGSTGKTLFYHLAGLAGQERLLSVIDRLLALGVDINSRDETGTTAFSNYVYTRELYAHPRFLVALDERRSRPRPQEISRRGIRPEGVRRLEALRAYHFDDERQGLLAVSQARVSREPLLAQAHLRGLRSLQPSLRGRNLGRLPSWEPRALYPGYPVSHARRVRPG